MADVAPSPGRRPRRNILRRNQTRWTVVCLVLGALLSWWWVARKGGVGDAALEGDGPQYFVRIATFNTSLYRDRAGALVADLRGGENEQARAVAEILQEVRPDIVLLNEFDFDAEGVAVQLFCDEYLGVGQGDSEPLELPHRFVAPVNTGVPSGMDLDGDGASDGPGDAWGYGVHPGQYGMVVLSRYPIRRDRVRTFQKLPWGSMPGHRMPDGFYSEAAAAVMPLSSKSHWDVPVVVGVNGHVIHVLASHPTPPVFDGAEDRNGRRNADEIRFWADYVDGERAGYVVDDAGVAGGIAESLADGESFVVVGDLNSDPVDGDSLPGAMQQLLEHPGFSRAAAPRSEGGALMARKQWGVNSKQQGEAAEDTGDFVDVVGEGPGNLRLDYVLPSVDLVVVRSGVFWPAPTAAEYALLGCSDHRAVWVDVGVR